MNTATGRVCVGRIDDSHSTVVPLCQRRYSNQGIPEPDPNDSGTNSLKSKSPPLSLRRRMGSYILMVLAVGIIALACGVGMICFLWTGSRNGTVWRRILISSWVPRTVALSALVIRTAIVTQAGACTSMIAAVALESGRVLLSEAAAASSIRFVNGGPHTLFSPLRRGGLKWKSVPMVLILALLATTAVSQFFSTLLLSDLKSGYVVSDQQQTLMPFGVNKTGGGPGAVDLGSLPGTSKPPFYPAFSEYSEIPYVEDGISDTGLTLRELLPLGSQDSRSLVQAYTGNATVFDSRIMCIQPFINGSIGRYLGLAKCKCLRTKEELLVV